MSSQLCDSNYETFGNFLQVPKTKRPRSPTPSK
jgi:hypothetical protein